MSKMHEVERRIMVGKAVVCSIAFDSIVICSVK